MSRYLSITTAIAAVFLAAPLVAQVTLAGHYVRYSDDRRRSGAARRPDGLDCPRILCSHRRRRVACSMSARRLRRWQWLEPLTPQRAVATPR